MLEWLFPLSKIWCVGWCLQQKSIQGGKRASRGETVEDWTLKWVPPSPRTVSAVKKGGSDLFLPNKCHIQKKRKKCYFSYIKTERPGYISTFPHVFTTEIKKKRHKGTHKGGKTAIFYNQLPLVKTVINGLAFVFFIYILTLAIYH